MKFFANLIERSRTRANTRTRRSLSAAGYNGDRIRRRPHSRIKSCYFRAFIAFIYTPAVSREPWRCSEADKSSFRAFTAIGSAVT